MAEFRTEYYTPMDRAYHERAEFDPARPNANIEEPIFPVAQVGQTVPEHDPSGRFKNILQNVQAAIRGGTGNLQIVFQTPLDSAIGGRPKAYGAEVRQAIKEVAMANEVLITGMEMPTSLTNMSGWDIQRGVVDEEKRQRDLDEVKEMVRFAAEVGQGGGVDIVSWEYDRPIHRAEWWDKEGKDAKAFKSLAKEELKKEEVRFVDNRSGQIGSIPIREGIPMFIDPETFKPIDPIEKEPILWGYDDFENYAKSKGKSASEVIKEHFLNEQKNMAIAQRGYYLEHLTHAKKMKEHFDEALELAQKGKTDQLAPQFREEYEKDPDTFVKRMQKESEYQKKLEQSYFAGLQEQGRIRVQTEERMAHWEPMEDYTLKKSAQSYAEAGMAAMQMQDKIGPQNLKQDLYVGPEIGWPQYYGSHPKEFVSTIMRAREEMVEVLTDRERCKDYGFDSPLSRTRAEEEAKRHIKGTFDTAHMGMWLQNFHPEMPWHKRIGEFNKWYKEQIEWLAKEHKKHDVIGAVQAVDSAGAAHGHLPPGQGILPVKEAMEILRTKGGFNGYVTSEGHEEEKFGEGRILLKTWQHFNSPISSGYGPGAPVGQRWANVQHGYFGKTYSPFFMFGAYAPSNEFKLWSEVPLE